MAEGKPAITSMTVLGNMAAGVVISFLSNKIPAVHDYVTANPVFSLNLASLLTAGMNIVWRIVFTKQPITGVFKT